MPTALTGNVSVSLTAQRTNISGNLVSESWSVADVSYDELMTQFLELPNLAVDTAINLGGVGSGTLLLIVSDQVISFKLNSGTVAIAFKTLLLTTAAITSIALSNASGSTANIRVVVLGT